MRAVIPWMVVGCAGLSPAAGPDSGLRALRTEAPIRVDGRLDEATWAQAEPASEFTQEWPIKGQPAHQHTEVRVLYDGAFLYVGARMHHDRTLEGGRAQVVRRLHRRDQDSQSDWFSVAIDSAQNRRTALVFEVNAGGVQKDQIIYNDATFDASWDGVWESAVSRDAEGWTAELKIPLSLLKFKPSEGPQTWGINFGRVDQGTVREFSRWRVVPRGESGFVSRFPGLTGLEGLVPRPRHEYLPYLSAARKFETTRSYDDRQWETRAGLDARWGLHSHAQVDLSLYPDFGQVEVDQAVLNLGTVETFFPEKRPFFLEGMDHFRVAGPDLFYSRRIGTGLSDPELAPGETLRDRPNATDISAAAKYTAKYSGGTNVGLLAARVEPAEAILLDARGQSLAREISPLTHYGVLRIQQVLDDRGSYVGLFASDMHQNGSDGRLAQVQALDGVLKSRDRSGFLEATVSRSQTGPREAQAWGWRGRLRANQRWGEGWSAEVQAIQATRDYNPNDLGYLSRADEQRVFAEVFRHWDRTWGVFRNWEAGFAHTQARDQAGRVFLRNLHGWAKTDFTNFFALWGGGGVDLASEDDRELRTYADPVKTYLARPSIPYASLGFDTPGNRPWYLKLNTSRAWHEGGPSTDATLFQILKPTPALEFQLTTAVSRDEGELKWLDTPVATPIVGLRRMSQLNQVLRVAYAFNPRFTVQLFSQWLAATWAYRDLQHPADGLALEPGLPADLPADAEVQTAFSYRAWNLNLITRWEFLPGSAFFLVYTHGTATDDLINDRASLSPGRDLPMLRHLPSDDIIQAKVSWLFR